MLDGHQNITHDILANRVGWRPMLWSFGRALSFRDAVDGIGGSTLRPCRMAYGSKRLPCPEERRAGLFMPIIRYSDRVIEHLIKQYDDGKAGHCEIGQSTLCNMTAWCTMANISSAWMSHLFGSPGGGVSDFRLYHAMVEHHPNKLLHPTRQVVLAPMMLPSSHNSPRMNSKRRVPGRLGPLPHQSKGERPPQRGFRTFRPRAQGGTRSPSSRLVDGDSEEYVPCPRSMYFKEHGGPRGLSRRPHCRPVRPARGPTAHLRPRGASGLNSCC